MNTENQNLANKIPSFSKPWASSFVKRKDLHAMYERRIENVKIIYKIDLYTV